MSLEQLIRACADLNDGAAWDEFVFRFHRAISLSIIRTAYLWGNFKRELVDDLVQETYLKLCADRCRALLEFAVQHPEMISGYIKTIAANVAHDHFKGLHSKKRGAGRAQESLTELETTAEIPDAGGESLMERQVLLNEINDCLERCGSGPDQERDRLIFWLHYQQGMSAKAIAALPTVGLTAKGVESAILRLTRLVRAHVISSRSASVDESEPPPKGFRPAESY